MKYPAVFPTGLHISQTLPEGSLTLEHSLGWKMDRFRMDHAKKRMTLEAVHTAHLQLAHTKRSFNVTIIGNAPQGCITIAMITNGAQTVSQFVRMDSSHLFVTDETQIFEWMTLAPTDILTVSIEKNFFYDRYFAYCNQNFSLPLYANIVACPREIVELSSQALITLLKNTLTNPSYQTSQAYNQALEEAVLGLLFPMLGQSRADIVIRKPDIVAYDLQQFIHNHYAENLTIDAMCDALKISRRNGHLAFKNLFGITPKHYQTRIRLGKVYDTLYHASDKRINVQEIAQDYGFTHMSHFSQHYKLFFGELPSRTLMKEKAPIHDRHEQTPHKE